MKSGRLTVIQSIGKRGLHEYARCKCDCGVEKDVRLYLIKRGIALSCGCLNKERLTKHGLSKHPLYGTYKQMMDRCGNPKNINFEYYGGRGIQVCQEWADPINGMVEFLAWADNQLPKSKSGLEIDRIYTNGGYGPLNCRFITRAAQNRNTRSNTRVVWGGEEMLFLDCFEKYGNHDLAYNAAWTRYSQGWPLEAAIIKPYMRVHQ